MFRNQYDNDITTWSPQGRIHQIEYAIEAAKQGSAAVGLRSNTHVVLLALNRPPDALTSHQRKVFKVDEHLGIAIAGIAPDARVLSRYMRNECLRSRYLYGRAMPVQRISNNVADRAQVSTQRYGGRPYGVALLIAGVDETGPHLFEFSPAGTAFEYVAMAIGARAQSAKTYFEKHYEKFAECSLDELVRHGVLALRDTLQSDLALTAKNCTIAVVSAQESFHMLPEERVAAAIADIEASNPRPIVQSVLSRLGAPTDAPADQAADTMQE